MNHYMCANRDREFLKNKRIAPNIERTEDYCCHHHPHEGCGDDVAQATTDILTTQIKKDQEILKKILHPEAELDLHLLEGE